jgi:GTP-binding protein HflX
MNQKINILIVGLITPQNRMVHTESYFAEFKKLIETNFITPKASYFTKLRSIDPSTFITKGKLEEIKKICIENDIDEIILSEKLSPHQEMKLEKILEVTVYDRNHLILEIFEKQAQTEEAKIQVQIAFLEHQKTRVAGHGSHFSQQSGRFGIISGAGETQKELDLRHIDHLLHRLKKELKNLEAHQERQRKERLKNNVFHIAIVGYTNAGKSTLFTTLTKSPVLAEDKLFATLTTTTRELFISDQLKRKVVITDTVGFIQNIPHELIESFKSTISELLYASLLIHVIDASNTDFEKQYETVIQTIAELGGGDIPTIEIYNKADLLSSEAKEEIIKRVTLYNQQYPDHTRKVFFTNAKNKETLGQLWQEIIAAVGEKQPSPTLNNLIK